MYCRIVKLLDTIHFILTGQPGRCVETPNTSETSNRTITSIVVDFGQETSEDLSRESSDSADWIRRLLTDDNQSSVERK